MSFAELAHEAGTTVIEPPSRNSSPGLREVWEYRDLLFMFALRDVKVRYQQTTVGIAWAILQPLLIMLVLSGFASLFGVKTGAVPYPLFAISGLVPWAYFTHALTQTTHSLVAQGGIMGKIYFPRLIVPIAAVLGGAADFLAAGLLLPAFMLYYGVRPTVTLAALPLFVLMALASALAIGLWLAVLNVRYRDVVNALPLVMQLMFFTTPIMYRIGLLREPWRTLAGLNPMVGVVDGFRWALLGDAAGGLHRSMAVSAVTILVLLATGVCYFRRQEPTFVDVM